MNHKCSSSCTSWGACDDLVADLLSDLAAKEAVLKMLVKTLEKIRREVICSYEHDDDATGCSHHEAEEALEAIKDSARLLKIAEKEAAVIEAAEEKGSPCREGLETTSQRPATGRMGGAGDWGQQGEEGGTKCKILKPEK